MNYLHKVFAVASAAFFIACPALAQNPGTVTNFAFATGRGAGKQGFDSVLCASTQIAIGQTAAKPVCAALSGDITMTSAGVTAIGAAKVTSAMLRDSAALSLLGRSANSSGVPADITAGGDFNIMRRSGTSIGFGSIDLSQSGAVGSSILAVGNGGTGQATANASRGPSGLNISGDQGTSHGDVSVTLGNTERMAYTTAALTTARTWTLPAANVTGNPYFIRITDMAAGITATNTLTIARAGSDTINGSTTFTLNAASQSADCHSDGTSKWACRMSGIQAFVAAAKSDQQSATSAALSVTPSQQQSHPSASKAWGYYTQSAGTYTLQQGYNIASLAKNGTGDLTVTFTTAFAAATFASTCSADTNAISASCFPASASSVRVRMVNTAGAATDSGFSFQSFGAQ